MVVTLPFVLLLLDYWPLGRAFGFRSFLEKAPFFLLSAFACVIAVRAQQGHGAMGVLAGLPFGARLNNAVISYCRYLGKMVCPTGLAVFYPHPGFWPTVLVLSCALLLVGLTLACLLLARRRRWLAVGWFWFLGTMVPVLGLVQVGGQSMADRYTYIPLLGVFLILVWAGDELLARHRLASWVISAGILVVCAAVGRQQVEYWKNSETLFEHALAVTRNNPLAQNSLGLALEAQGRLHEAIEHFQEAVQLWPNQTDARANLANALFRSGRVEEGIRQYEQVIQLDPKSELARHNLGLALCHQGRFDEGLEQFQEALRLAPNSARSHCDMGAALAAKGRREEAITELNKALELRPDYPQARQQLQALTGPPKP
jgi:cytochrome c-type biogenesis protein CcmH/NrfG